MVRSHSSGFLNHRSTYHILVDGPIGSKELDRLIKKLQVDKDILDEDTSADIMIDCAWYCPTHLLHISA